MYHTVPDFSAFDIKTEVVHAAGDDRALTATAGYGFAYITALLVVSVLIFARRDFKRGLARPEREWRWHWRRSPGRHAAGLGDRVYSREAQNRAFLYA